MGWLGAHLFTRLQATPFYRRLHEDAVTALPPGDRRSWIDAGCGPGLIPRLAAAHGYAAIGIDHDDAMVTMARRLDPTGRARYQTAGLPVPTSPAAVVSASSLLVAMPDPTAGLAHLWAAVAPGGALLVIEAASAMTLANANALMAREEWARPSHLLRLWAFLRQHRTWDARALAPLRPLTRPLLGGLVEAHFCRKAEA